MARHLSLPKRLRSRPALSLAVAAHPSPHAQAVIRRPYSSSTAYDETVSNLRIGTKVVGGVSPGKGGIIHQGRPVFNTVREAMAAVKPDVSSVFLDLLSTPNAIIEAIEAEVPLVVSVAETIRAHDVQRVHEILRTPSRTRLAGPNCPRIIAPDQCVVGIMPYGLYARGCVGIVSKSEMLSYEAAESTTKVGLGQSIVVGIGRDKLPGTTLADGLRFFFDHKKIKGIIVIGEIGGDAELKAADLVKEYRRATPNPKPIIAMVAADGAFPSSKRNIYAEAKVKALENAGAVVVPHPGVMGQTMMELLGKR